MVDSCDIAAAELSKAHGTSIESDHRLLVDREPQLAPVELTDDEPWRQHTDDDPAVDPLRGRRARRRADKDGAEKHQREPSHVRMLANAGQGSVWCM
jgi:hypothetical protein